MGGIHLENVARIGRFARLAETAGQLELVLRRSRNLVLQKLTSVDLVEAFENPVARIEAVRTGPIEAARTVADPIEAGLIVVDQIEAAQIEAAQNLLALQEMPRAEFEALVVEPEGCASMVGRAKEQC